MPRPSRMLALAALAPLPLLALPERSGAAPPPRVAFAVERASAAAAVAGDRRAIPVTGVPVATVDGGLDPSSTARRIAALPGVAWAEVDRTYRVAVPRGTGRAAASSATDPRRRGQWALAMINVEAGWGFARIASLPALDGVPIAIVDTGIATSHEDLKGRIRACGASFAGKVREGICDDRDGHGTHVAGIAAAATGNSIGIAGVAAGSPLIACRALGGPGQGSGADVAGCIGWAVRKGARVISLSLGGPDGRTLRSAIEAATAAGALVVAAAGNEGNSTVSFPAGYRSVISVGAVGQSGRRAPFSNTNPDVELAAPGAGILSLAPGSRYREMSGTSMAVPHVSGAAALVWQGLSRPSAGAVRTALQRSARDAGPRGRDREYGLGIVDLARLGS